MPLTGIRKRNSNRTRKYGPRWRQVYYDADGVCMLCGDTDTLEFHHEEGSLRMVCRGCHVEVIHEGEQASHLSDQPKHLYSMLTEDINTEIKALGLDKWKKLYRIVDKE